MDCRGAPLRCSRQTREVKALPYRAKQELDNFFFT